ncbi:MAG: arsenate reductase (glutaredoxin) [Sphingomonadaceae bacterium]|nr:arsenate reductase (glutaredoxin) [Sphingomonadaceae bacterium]
MKATIYHNPRCSKSRETLAILQAHPEIDLQVVDYLNHPPSAGELARLYNKAGMTARQGLRKTEAGAKDLSSASEAAILDAMAASPALIERPLVETSKGVRLGRPPETVREIL